MGSKGSVPRGTLPFVISLMGSATLAVLTFGEAVHARASAEARAELRGNRQQGELSVAPDQGPRCSVIVLGFANRGTRPNAVNRWRARIAARTALRMVSTGATVSVICCGGAVRGTRAEADLLAEALRGTGWRGDIQCDRESVSTWENIANARKLLDDPAMIALCSNGLHAAKARAYLRRQDPRLGERLVPADDYRFGEMMLFKPIFAAVGLWKLAAIRRVSRGTQSSAV
ncbi:YdcF family protein [Curtobacterium oceanosedimentum]|uniref:YdcF family protein n=1 Tax=Curtobacterium oceanosedimentum TaxID=465820 RepID=UPI000A6CD873|nr:YdcF family protein [Curtobacterium oceanosedimentum]